VDHQTLVQLEFTKDQHAQLFTSISAETEGEALIIGTKGKLKLPFPFLCPVKLVVTLNQGETWTEAAGEGTFFFFTVLSSPFFLFSGFLCALLTLVSPGGIEGKDTRERVFESPLPSVLPGKESSSSFNFINSAGLVYEAEEVHDCLTAGSLESSVVSHEFSLALVKLTDNIRQQIGLKFPME
jgi:hypothetical protein